MPFLDGKPVIITKRNTDKHGNPISVKQIETKQVVDIHNSIPLNYSIDRNHPIVINGLYQIYNKDEISENTFYADYDQGILYFHPTHVGKSITITYMGTGYILISSDRIYRYNKGDGTSTTESIEASLEKLENILNTIIKNGGGCDQIVAEVIGSRTDAQGQTFPSLGDRLNYITTQLDNLTAIVRYKRVLKVDTDITTVTVGIAEYNPKRDTLSVYLSGVRMIEGEDYSLDENNRAITCLKGQWNIGDELYFEVLQRSTDSTPPGGGGSLPTSIDALNVVLNNPMFGANNAQDAFIQIDILLKDKVDKKDFNDLTNNFNLLNQEVIDARTSGFNQEKYGTIGRRMDHIDELLDDIAINFICLGGEDGKDNTKIFELANNILKDGDTLLLPQGTYYTNFVQFTKGISLKGNNAIIKLNDNQNSKLFEYSNASNFNIYGVIFDGNKDNNSQTSGHALQLMNCNNAVVTNVRCENHNGNGFRGSGCNNVTIEKSIFSNNKSVNALFENSTNCKFINNECNNSGGFGLQLKGDCLYCTIENNHTHNNGREGINIIDGGSNNIIKNNYSYKNGDGGIVVGFDNVGGSTMPKKLIIDGNICYENRYDGININNTGMKEFTIINNECFNNNQAGHNVHKYGIFIANNVTHTTIDNNRLYDDQGNKTQQYGLFLGTGARVNVGHSNTFYGNKEGDIFESASGDCNNSIHPKAVNYENLLLNPSFENWSGLKTCDNWSSGGDRFDLAQETSTVKSGKAIKLLGGSTSGYIRQAFTDTEKFKGSRLKLSCWVYTDEVGAARARIYSHQDGTVLYSTDTNTKTGWQRLVVERPISDAIKDLYIRLEVLSNKTAIFDEAILTQEFI